MTHTTVGVLYDQCARYYGPEIALQHHQRVFTYQQMGAQAEKLAAALFELGLRKGDKVAFMMANCPEYVFAEIALAKMGAVRVPLAVLLSADDHIYMINHSEAVALIYHQKLAERATAMQPQLPAVRHFIAIGDDPAAIAPGHVHLQTLMDSPAPPLPAIAVSPDDLCGLYYTGGTTGRPKGVMLSHRAWVHAVMLEMLELGLGWNETFAFMTPLTHAGGVLLLPVLLRKGRCLILDGFSPQTFLAQVEQERVTAALLVPTMIYLLLDDPHLADYDTSSLRAVLYGAAPIAAERLAQAIDRFGPVFAQFYGQTESPMILTALSPSEHVIADPDRRRQVFSSCGRPTMTTQIKLLDGAGQEAAPGEVGEIVARSTFMMDGYFKDPAKTAETIVDGWLHTGDLAWQDQQGFLYIVDRLKDMIVSGGFNIYPREIEDVLFEHPAVKNAAVIGVPHEKWGEAAKAIVVLHPGQQASEAELIEFVKTAKGSLVAPKSVEFWDAIPLTNLGKVDKKKMREPYWRGHARRV